MPVRRQQLSQLPETHTDLPQPLQHHIQQPETPMELPQPFEPHPKQPNAFISYEDINIDTDWSTKQASFSNWIGDSL